MEPLDLVDIALLLNYERCASEPRFRHAKLREVAFPGEEPESLAIKAKFWSDDSRPRTVIVLDRPSQDREETSSEPDTPSNFLPKKLVPWDRLRGLESKRLETLYYQTRGHNACFTCVALIQHFFDLFEPETPIRVRHGPKGNAAGGSYHTPIERRNIVEMTMIRPKQTTISVVAPEGMTYVSGEEETMVHAVIGFARPGGSDIISFFDLSSMQFGDIGRGPGAKGQGLFALDTIDEFQARMEKICHGTLDSKPSLSTRVGPSPDDDRLRKIAMKTKERWDNRANEKWCGHCGAPASSNKSCGGCRNAWYCNEAHQRLAWPFHKHYCGKK